MTNSPMNRARLTGAEARDLIRRGRWAGPTAGLAEDYVQANLVVLPEAYAADFGRFCALNPRPCPLLGVTGPGSPDPAPVAKDADIRHDLPLYRVYRDGRPEADVGDIASLWQSDFVAFLLGCSFTFEKALRRAGVPLRHLELGCNVPMFRTSVACRSAGPFQGPLVVTMRPVPESLVQRASEITSCFPRAHGAPVHIGDPGQLGIADLARPDYGDPVPVLPGEVPMFWACGVTPQAVAQSAGLPLMITHAPGHMFITDLREKEMHEQRSLDGGCGN